MSRSRYCTAIDCDLYDFGVCLAACQADTLFDHRSANSELRQATTALREFTTSIKKIVDRIENSVGEWEAQIGAQQPDACEEADEIVLQLAAMRMSLRRNHAEEVEHRLWSRLLLTPASPLSPP